MVEQEGALEVLMAPIVWAGPYPNVPLAASCTMVSAGGVSQAVITVDRRDMNGLSALRDSSRRHQSQPKVHVSKEGEPALSNQLAKGEPEAGRSYEQRPEGSP